MAITTDPTTDIGKVRLLIADTDATTYVFEDNEITAFLSLANSNVHRASAMAVRAIASNRAYLAKRIKREGYEDDQQAISDLLELAKSLDKQALTGAGLVIGELPITDEHFDSYRPEWRDETTLDTQ